MPRVVEKSFGFLEHSAGCTNGCEPLSAMIRDELVARAERFKCPAFVAFMSAKQYDRYIKLLTPRGSLVMASILLTRTLSTNGSTRGTTARRCGSLNTQYAARHAMLYQIFIVL